MDNNKELLYTILCHTTTKNSDFNENLVISTASIYTNLASKLNKKCNVFQKLKSLLLHTFGLTNDGMTVMNKLGDSLSSRAFLDVRTDLAIKDEELMMSWAKDHQFAYVIDNLDIEHNKIMEHKTLPIILCRKVLDSVESMDDKRLTLEENLVNFNLEFLLLDSVQNTQEKCAFMEVAFSIKK